MNINGREHAVAPMWQDERLLWVLREAVPHGGYCQLGQMMATVALLCQHPRPSTEQVASALDGHLCCCSTQDRVRSAVAMAAKAHRGQCMKCRAFLSGTTVLLAGRSQLPVVTSRPLPAAEQAMGWIRHEAGRYTLWLPRAELGQHINTALAANALQELGTEPQALVLKRPSADDTATVRATVGSESVALFALALAHACATLREAVAAGRTGTVPAQAWPVSALKSFAPGGPWVGQSLAQAAQELAHTEHSLAQIGYRCGYADQAQFTRSFHGQTGITPANFRREFQSASERGRPTRRLAAANSAFAKRACFCC